MEHIIPLLDSIDKLLADVNKVRSSEMSLKRFASLIDEEFQVESKHMAATKTKANVENKDNNIYSDTDLETKKKTKTKVNVENKKNNACSLLVKSIKWIIGLSFLTLFCFALVPERTELTVNTIRDYISSFRNSQSVPEYNISDTHWYFRAFQMLRLGSTSLQIERKFPISDFDESACLVNNPFYQPDMVKCSACKKIKGFDYNHPEDELFSVLIKSGDVKFNVARLQQVLQRNEIMINQHTVLVQANVDYVRVVDDLKSNGVLERLEKDDRSHVSGTFLSFMSSHILRKELPRPMDYNLVTEGQTFRSFLYLDGKHSPSFQLSKTPFHSVFMYIQCSGSRRLVFSPPEHCHHRCDSLSRVMKPGDIAFFSTIWSVNSEPTDERSLATIDVLE